MLLSTEEANLFLKLQSCLMKYANDQLKVLPPWPIADLFQALSAGDRRKLVVALLEQPGIIKDFVTANPDGLSLEERAIVAQWSHAVPGKFIVFRTTKKHTIFLTKEAPPIAYGVVALTRTLEDVMQQKLPGLVETVLLPFRGRIIYDGLLGRQNVKFAPGAKSKLNTAYRGARQRHGLITALPASKRSTKGGLKKTPIKKPATAAKRAHTDQMWIKQIDGERIDLRRAPRSVQLRALELGLIPHIPPKRIRLKRAKPVNRVFQFKITLKEVQPPIWRRIQVLDETLDRFHELIQTAMGWTNSHLYMFHIDGNCHGDLELLEDTLDDSETIDSNRTLIHEVVPRDGKRSQFEYEYDFGDCWEHEVIYEGSPKLTDPAHYPVCLEGERACPPENVGGAYGFEEYLEAVADPNHEAYDDCLEWNGTFEPDSFDPEAATRAMRKGLPDWREMV
jgi:hypothetical protein